MARLTIAGVSVALMLVPGAAMAQPGSRVGAPPMAAMTAVPAPVLVASPMPPRATPIDGNADRWRDVPGGWSAYRRPSYGFALPGYWASAPHYIADYDRYGLPAPASGFGWSRYYDDAVLTDRYGRVYEWRDSGRTRTARWNADGFRYIDDRGDRRSHRKGRRDGRQYSYEGTWTGSWDGGPERVYKGRFDGNVRTHWSGGYDHGSAGQYPHGWIEGPTVTTTTVTPGKPVMTETVRYVTEYVTTSAPRTKYVRRGKYVRR